MQHFIKMRLTDGQHSQTLRRSPNHGEIVTFVGFLFVLIRYNQHVPIKVFRQDASGLFQFVLLRLRHRLGREIPRSIRCKRKVTH